MALSAPIRPAVVRRLARVGSNARSIGEAAFDEGSERRYAASYYANVDFEDRPYDYIGIGNWKQNMRSVKSS